MCDHGHEHDHHHEPDSSVESGAYWHHEHEPDSSVESSAYWRAIARTQVHRFDVPSSSTKTWLGSAADLGAISCGRLGSCRLGEHLGSSRVCCQP